MFIHHSPTVRGPTQLGDDNIVAHWLNNRQQAPDADKSRFQDDRSKDERKTTTGISLRQQCRSTIGARQSRSIIR
jgi:hypothetical protein